MSAHPFRFSVQASTAESGADWTRIARRTEELGYSTLFMADHYQGPGTHGAQDLAAVPAMAAAAAVTTTLRVGARVLCIDYRPPAVLAKEMATLEFLSGGRLELGLGAGWVKSEYEAMGIPFDSAGVRIDRLAEVTTFIKAFFTGDELDTRGTHVTVTGYKGTPAPTQKPHPPIMIGGGGKRVLRLAGAQADIVSFNFNNRAGVVGPDGVGSSTAEATDEKVRWVQEGAGSRFDDIELEIGAYFTVVTDDAITTAAKMGAMFGLDGDAMLDHPNALIGSVNEISDRLQQRRDRYGFSYVSVSQRNMEAFAPVVELLHGR